MTITHMVSNGCKFFGVYQTMYLWYTDIYMKMCGILANHWKDQAATKINEPTGKITLKIIN